MLTWLRTLSVLALVGAAHAQSDSSASSDAFVGFTTDSSAATDTIAGIESSLKTKSKPKNQPKVLVLGAGMSGVMTANTLYEKGFKDITIIEANDYIGGRMKPTTFAGRHIELGANWVHGISDNPIYDLAVSKGMKLVETNWSSVVYLPLGADPNEDAEVEHFEEAYEKTEERAERYRDKGKKDLTVQDGLRYEGWVAHTPLEQALLYNEMDLDIGPAEDTSFELGMNIATYEKDDHDMLVVDGKGYNSLAHDLLAKNFPNPLNNTNVHLSTKVDKIVYTSNGVTVLATTNGKQSTYNADFVVTTFSAGVLRNKAQELFVPTLPEDKLDAIYRVDMTLFLKVFVETTEKFWADVTDGAETWIYADEVKGNFTLWMDMSLPKLGDNYASPKNGTFVAMSMIASDYAAYAQKLTNDQLKDQVIKAMRAMFPKAADRISTKTVTSVVMEKWGENELFGGSWANPARDFKVDDFKKLGEPVGRVYFSGEHTSPEYFGYVHGAYRAGIATAKQLMQRKEFA